MVGNSEGFNFSDDLRRLIHGAGEEIFRLRHPAVTPVHLLLAITSTTGHTVHRILRRLSINLASLRAEVESTLPLGNDQPTGSAFAPMFSMEAKDVLEQAMRAARDASHSEVNSGHLLLGLLAVRGPAQKHLSALPLQRADVIRALAGLLARGEN